MAKPIETLSPSDEAIFRTATLKSLQGAAEDPERIGVEHMPQEIVSTVILADTSASTEDAGAIGLNARGKVVVHTGDANGSEMAELLDSTYSQRFAIQKVGSTMDNTLAAFALCELPMDAGMATSGNVILIQGFFDVNWTNANKPDFIYFCFSSEGNETIDLATHGIYYQIGTGTTGERVEFSLLVSLNASGENWNAVVSHIGPGAYIRNNAAGTITHAVGWTASPDALGAVTGVSAARSKLMFYIATYDESDAVDSTLAVRGQVGISKVTL
jgi:hypothetical protein